MTNERHQPRPRHSAARNAARVALLAALALAACEKPREERNRGDTAPPPPSGPRASNGQRVADDGNWVLPSKDVQGTRFSGLDQINTGNVANLKLAWTFSTGVLRGQEAAPLYADGTIYVVTPFPNILYALDLTGAARWSYKPRPSASAQGVACCDVVNRGAVLEGGKVIVGNSGGEMGVRGWLTALDVNTGRQVWRAYATGPDKDVLIGPRFHPHYAQDRGVDLGVKTWPGDAWKIGGGTMWGWVTYDPETNLIFAGTAN
ncbi:MAG TPA: PQQ-binding-like beta-propeller repeat protein, partial [Longimicrobiaceae bacterium]|nr:PQQ-binding-like beta-propeller repeat protein [Longimicrobiaceae bacterium]